MRNSYYHHIFTPEKYSTLKNIPPWQIFTLEIFTPKRYSYLKNIHSWKIFTPQKYSPLKIFKMGDGCSVSNGHYFGRRAEFFYGDMVTPSEVTSEKVGIVVISRCEKRAPPIIARSQKGHCWLFGTAVDKLASCRTVLNTLKAHFSFFIFIFVYFSAHDEWYRRIKLWVHADSTRAISP